MGNEGNGADFNLAMPSLDPDLPEPTLNLGGDSSALNLADLKLDAPLDPPGTSPGQGDAAASDKKAGKKADKKKQKPTKPAKKPRAPKPKKARPALPRLSAGALPPVIPTVMSIIILLFICGIMYVFEVPINAVPDLTLTTYVQSLWLIVGCLFVLTMLHDPRTALIVTGVDIAMPATVFPTLWLLLDTPMNPMYFFVTGMIVLLALVILPPNPAKVRKPAAGKAAAPMAAAPAPTGPRTAS
jgi:hypothetical protein